MNAWSEDAVIPICGAGLSARSYRKARLGFVCVVVLWAAAVYGGSHPANAAPDRETPFRGKIAVNVKDSVPDWPKPVVPPPGAPDILLIMLDDVGFADTGTFGGAAETPVLDRLAAEGLRYNRFHTAAICSPTRAALLSGRNQHRVGYGAFGGAGFPGYDGIWKRNAASVAEVLKRNGYSTAAFGKWHNTPYQEITPIGPFDRWPTGLGFEYFYGNLLGMSSQWEPELWRNTQMIAPPATARQGYHFTTDMTDEAIRWIHTHQSLAPEKPYFVYFATEAAHAPHHVPKEWIGKYRGQFDQGWDRLREEIFARQKKLGVIPRDAELTPRPVQLPAWSSLSPAQQRLFARQMELYAAFITHTDHEIGRLIEAVKSGPNADNTLIVYIVGDNGAEAIGGIDGTDDLPGHFAGTDEPLEERLHHMEELGGPRHLNIYAAAWAWTGSTPFQWVKHVASHFGGTRNPLVISWRARIEHRGGIRSQFSYVTDVAATLYEAAGIHFPEAIDGIRQLPLDGVSLMNTFDHADAPSPHRVQYFEAEGNRAIYQDGWIGAARHAVPWVLAGKNGLMRPDTSDFGLDRWELYHEAQDFSQAHDVAAQFPQKLAELQKLFDMEARRNDVYPLGAGSAVRAPVWSEGKRRFVFRPGVPTLLGVGLPGLSRPQRVTAELVIPQFSCNGVILARGGRNGGATLYVKDNRVIYENNIAGKRREVLMSQTPLPPGAAQVVVELGAHGRGGDREAVSRLYVNGAVAQETNWSANPARGGVFDVGRNSVSPVSEAYEPPFQFNGTIESLTIELE